MTTSEENYKDSAEPRRPRAVMLVMNHITGDSRVQKVAMSMAEAGWDVYLLGRAKSEKRETSRLGEANVIRIPVPMHVTVYRKEATRRGLLGRIGFNAKQHETARRLEIEFRRRDYGAERMRILDELSGAGRFAGRRARGLRRLRLWLRLRRAQLDFVAHRARNAVRREAGRRHRRYLDNTPRPVARLRAAWFGVFWRYGGWRRLRPQLIDFDLAFGKVIDQLEPDIIHAHDITTIGIAVRAAARVTACTGRICRVIYDSHELTAGAPAYGPEQRTAYLGLEREYIHQVDRVVTVSDTIARMLKDRYKLRELPVVITNSPVMRIPDDPRTLPDLRRSLDLPAGTPLLVYSGWLAPERGVDTVVRALPDLPDVHLAVVTSEGNRYLPALEELAERLGVRDRLHVHTYVPPHQVAAFLSSATIGVIPLHHLPNHEIALITKYYEYMHARLPIVVSDVKAMAEYTRELGNGEVFKAGDPKEFAVAVRKVLADRARYVSVYDRPGLLEEHSWERQAEKLAQLYSELTGLRPEPPARAGAPAARARTRPTGDLAVRPSLVIGPSNMAGQAWAWAKAIERHWPDVRTEVFTLDRDTPLQFPTDHRITGQQWQDSEWHLWMRRHVIETHTHVLFEGGLALTGRWGNGYFPEDAAAFTEAGLHVGLVFHGSDIRNPRLHRELYPDSPFADPTSELTVATQRRYDALAKALADFEGPCFVSTLDLLDFLPTARWLPVTVDTTVWRPGPELFRHDKPVVLHAPSRAAIKGSAAADTVAQQMHDEGLIEYRRLEKVPPERMPEVIAEADIVLDQFAVGSYGVLATQAMAAGRVVVGHVVDHVRARLLHQLPIVEARRSSLREVLEKLVSDRDECRRLAAQGPEFVRRYHDGTYAAGVLADFLIQARTRKTQGSE